jgi:hypothetical protein
MYSRLLAGLSVIFDRETAPSRRIGGYEGRQGPTSRVALIAHDGVATSGIAAGGLAGRTTCSTAVGDMAIRYLPVEGLGDQLGLLQGVLLARSGGR